MHHLALCRHRATGAEPSGCSCSPFWPAECACQRQSCTLRRPEHERVDLVGAGPRSSSVSFSSPSHSLCCSAVDAAVSGSLLSGPAPAEACQRASGSHWPWPVLAGVFGRHVPATSCSSAVPWIHSTLRTSSWLRAGLPTPAGGERSTGGRQVAGRGSGRWPPDPSRRPVCDGGQGGMVEGAMDQRHR
jgi:hypothetical protein